VYNSLVDKSTDKKMFFYLQIQQIYVVNSGLINLRFFSSSSHLTAVAMVAPWTAL
jgi:hypothetical protein